MVSYVSVHHTNLIGNLSDPNISLQGSKGLGRDVLGVRISERIRVQYAYHPQ